MASGEPAGSGPAAFEEAAVRIRALLASQELGFIATASSHWHALGVDAWVAALRASGERRKGVVLLLPHAVQGLITAAKDLPLCRKDGNVEIIPVGRILPGGGLRKLARMVRTALRLARLWLAGAGSPSRRDRPVLRLASQHDAGAAVFTLAQIGPARLLRDRDIRFVLLDEGLGTYTSQALWRYARQFDRSAQGRIVGTKWLDSLLYDLWHRVQSAIAERYPQQSRPVFLRDDDTGSLVPNAPVVAEYRRAARVKDGGTAALDRSDRPVALILTQTWTEYGQVDPSFERRLLEQTVENVTAGGFDVYLKPHPRGPTGQYEAIVEGRGERGRILSGDWAVESLLGALEPEDVVIGFNTTSLLTASLIYGLKTYTIGEALAARAETGEWFRDAQRVFRELAGEAVRDLPEHLAAD